MQFGFRLEIRIKGRKFPSSYFKSETFFLDVGKIFLWLDPGVLGLSRLSGPKALKGKIDQGVLPKVG